MAFLLTDLDALEAAIATGIRRVSYANGNSVEYASLADMMAARALMRQALGLYGPSQTLLAAHDRGYGAGGTFGRFDSGDNGDL